VPTSWQQLAEPIDLAFIGAYTTSWLGTLGARVLLHPYFQSLAGNSP
jgi:hypothetical protein